MSATTEIQRLLRHSNRYTGDGLDNEPANAPLPDGLQTSGAYEITNDDLIAALLIALSGGTGNPATVPQLVQTVASLSGNAGPSLPTDVDPTTIFAFDGQNKIWRGRIYYWTGLTYAPVQVAAQIDAELNESRVWSPPNYFLRNPTTGVWELEVTTTGTETNVAPDQPTGTATGEDGQISVAITPGASSGSSALDTIYFIWTPPGASEPVEIDTGLSAAGTYILPVNDDLTTVTGQLVAQNTEGLRSSIFTLNAATTDGPPAQAILVAADVTEGVGYVDIDVQAVATNGQPITDVIAIAKRRT